MPSSYDPRPSLLWMAQEAFEQAEILIRVGMANLERAGAASDERYQQALEMVRQERARVESATLIYLMTAPMPDLDDC